MVFLDKITHLLNGILIWLAGLMLGAMIVLTCANIFLRTVWLPVSGTFELMGYFSAVAMAFALGIAFGMIYEHAGYPACALSHVVLNLVGLVRLRHGQQGPENGAGDGPDSV